MSFATVTYLDRFRVTIMGKASKFSNKDLEILARLIEEKFLILAEQIKLE